MTPCTCTTGLRCPEAERLFDEAQRLREQYVRGGHALDLAAWQKADMAYKQHQAAAYGGQVSAQKETRQ